VYKVEHAGKIKNDAGIKNLLGEGRSLFLNDKETESICAHEYELSKKGEKKEGNRSLKRSFRETNSGTRKIETCVQKITTPIVASIRGGKKKIKKKGSRLRVGPCSKKGKESMRGEGPLS